MRHQLSYGKDWYKYDPSRNLSEEDIKNLVGDLETVGAESIKFDVKIKPNIPYLNLEEEKSKLFEWTSPERKVLKISGIIGKNRIELKYIFSDLKIVKVSIYYSLGIHYYPATYADRSVITVIDNNTAEPYPMYHTKPLKVYLADHSEDPVCLTILEYIHSNVL